MPSEGAFKSKLIARLREMFPGCIVMKNDPNIIQGIPDLTILYGPHWAALETKKSEHAPCQPNQEYYVELMNEMSFARIVYPENVEEVLYDLQQSFAP